MNPFRDMRPEFVDLRQRLTWQYGSAFDRMTSPEAICDLTKWTRLIRRTTEGRG